MKGTADEPQYAVGLLEGGVTLCDVIDNHIYEQTLVGVGSSCRHFVFNADIVDYYVASNPCLMSLFSLLSLRRMPSLWQTWEL